MKNMKNTSREQSGHGKGLKSTHANWMKRESLFRDDLFYSISSISSHFFTGPIINACGNPLLCRGIPFFQHSPNFNAFHV